MSERDQDSTSRPGGAERPETPPPLPPSERDVADGYVPPSKLDTPTPQTPEEDDE